MIKPIFTSLDYQVDSLTSPLEKNQSLERSKKSTPEFNSYSHNSHNATYYIPIKYFNNFQSTKQSTARTNYKHSDYRFSDQQLNSHKHLNISESNNQTSFLNKNSQFKDHLSNNISEILGNDFKCLNGRFSEKIF